MNQNVWSALAAYQRLMSMDARAIFGRAITSDDIDALRQEKRRLLEIMQVACEQEGWHRKDWQVIGDRVVCAHCRAASALKMHGKTLLEVQK